MALRAGLQCNHHKNSCFVLRNPERACTIPAMNCPYRRILVTGSGGAGKSTLAVELARRLSLPVVHLDKLWWLPGWKERTEAEFDALLEAELAKPEWVIDGNFRRTFARRLECAELCIFLDYPESVCMDGILRRVQEYHGRTRPDMTDGCPERIDSEFREWVRTFRSRVRPELISAMNESPVKKLIFTSREETAEWLSSLEPIL